MRIEKLNQTTKKNLLEDLLKRSPNSYEMYDEQVKAILDNVKKRGDEALFEYTEKFDGFCLDQQSVLVKEEEIEELTLEIANTRSVTPQVKEEVINEFYEVCLAQQYIAEGGINYAKELLEKALGSDKAMDVIGKLTASLQVKPFEFVRKTDASQLINFIQDEHPQTIALILSYLSPSQAALIISALPPDSQAEVARRIAVMDRTSPDVIKEVE